MRTKEAKTIKGVIYMFTLAVQRHIANEKKHVTNAEITRDRRRTTAAVLKALKHSKKEP